MANSAGGGKESPVTEGAGEALPRRGPAHHPLLIEVAGCMEDEVVRDVTQRLRKYRNRYEMLLRCIFTLVASAVPESHLFGDDNSDGPRPLSVGGLAGSSGNRGAAKGVVQPRSTRPLFAAPRFAMSVNKTYPLVRRFYPSQGGVEDGSEVPKGETPAASQLRLPWVDDGRSCPAALAAGASDPAACKERAVRQLEHFMTYHFLPFAMTHNIPASPTSAAAAPSAQPTFVLRHYINEASRTASFLFVDPFHTPCGATATAEAVAPAQQQQQQSPLLLPAVLVDPREEQLDAYRADLARFGATVTHVIFTHCYVDGSAGLSQLQAHFPSLHVVSGVPLSPAGTTTDVVVSTYLRLRTIAIPAFSPECMLVEVHAGDVLVGLCTGVLWSSDAAPRWDLLHWSTFPATSSEVGQGTVYPEEEESGEASAAGAAQRQQHQYGGGDRDAALAHTHRVLRQFFYEPYLAPLCGPTPPQEGERRGKSARTEGNEEEEEKGEEDEIRLAVVDAAVDRLQRVVLLATHGGYSNVTNQLDLYWASHLGDLARMKHSRLVIDTLGADEKTFVRYNTRLPRLPHPPLFDASRVFHLRQLLASISAEQRRSCVAGLPQAMRLALASSFHPFATENSAASPQSLTSFVNVVDVREAKDYHALHLSGAVNVPMSFPGTQYGARRAELWLQCVLVPHQPILALCAAAAQKAEVQRRLAALSPGCNVAVFTLEDLPHLAEAAAAPQPAEETSPGVPWRELYCERPSGLPIDVPVPQELVWIQHAGALVRLTTYEHLVAIEPTDTRVVLDVRTPYEFKNGSHQHSVHVQLSEMCTLAVEDAMRESAPPSHRRNGRGSGCGGVSWHAGSSPRLADAYMEKVHTTALLAGLPIVRHETALSDVVIYCAGGYRSLIAASLLQRAVETSANPAWRSLHIADVSGGAFQIMTQRPDLWRVKDRSIICIS